jgi:hypothetical protein
MPLLTNEEFWTIRRITVVLIFVVMVAFTPRAARVRASALTAEAGATTAVFQGDTLDDLARLLRPLTFSASAASGRTQTLYLRDAVYAGSVDGQARILTLWLTTDTSDQTEILAHADGSKPLSAVAQALQQGTLSNVVFALLPVQAAWSNWTLTVSRAGDAVVAGPPGLSTDIQSAIANSSTVVVSVDSRSVGVPVGYGLTKATGWASWFDSGQIIIRMVPLPIGVAPTLRPDITALGGKAGLLVGDGFLNNVFSNEHVNRIWVTSQAQKEYRIRDLRFTAHQSSLLLSANLLDVPTPAMVSLQAALSGSDLKPSNVSGTVDCKTLSISDCLQLESNVNVATIALNLKLQSQNQPVRPTDIQQLGNFYIGSKALHGIARIDDMQSVQGAAVLIGTFRFQGGFLR